MLGGLTTFITMAYIIVVNPQILSKQGCLRRRGVRDVPARCGGDAGDGFIRGYPIALAPGMS
jgi:AGZA family xanthine/uracil permease-like MFS transporter